MTNKRDQLTQEEVEALLEAISDREGQLVPIKIKGILIGSATPYLENGVLKVRLTILENIVDRIEKSRVS